VDLYQVNCTFYDALGRDDDRYLLARALQFWTPGIPQVYYVGLLAGSNDMALLARTGVGRDVNRHHYSPAEIETDLAKPVVQALRRLIQFRNIHPAFEGTMTSSGSATRIVLSWAHAGHEAVLDADLVTGSGQVTWTHNGARRQAPLASLP
jgi:sucrose phosphorylase